MPRHADGIQIIEESDIWAGSISADKTVLPDIDVGYDISYESTKYPSRRHMNDIFAKLSSIGYDVNRFGAVLPWDTLVIYEQYAWVTGSDGNIYRSVAGSNLGFDPTAVDGGSNPINVPSKWITLDSYLDLQSIRDDITNNPFFKYAQFQHRVASGTASGNFTAGDWRQRPITTEVTNHIGITLSGNALTFPAGTYRVIVIPSVYAVGNHQSKLSIVSGSDVIIGMSAADGDNALASQSRISGEFVLASETILEVLHRCLNGQPSNGFGRAVNFGVDEIYLDFEIWKLS